MWLAHDEHRSVRPVQHPLAHASEDEPADQPQAAASDDDEICAVSSATLRISAAGSPCRYTHETGIALRANACAVRSRIASPTRSNPSTRSPRSTSPSGPGLPSASVGYAQRLRERPPPAGAPAQDALPGPPREWRWVSRRWRQASSPCTHLAVLCRSYCSHGSLISGRAARFLRCVSGNEA